MKQDWTWHRVLADIGSGALDSPLLEVVKRSACPVLLWVNGGFVDDPASYNPYAPPMGWSYLSFESNGQGLQLRSSHLTGTQFSHVSTCESLPDLAGALSQIRQLEWTWINLHLGLELEFAPLEPGTEYDPDVWEAPQLWDRCLAPWLPWVV